MTNLLGTKGMHIKSWYAAMDKDNLTIYQNLQHFKAARKSLIKYYSQKFKSSISILQNKSSAVIDCTIHRSYKNITSSNDMRKSEISSFGTASNITTKSNKISNSIGSLILVIDGNSQKSITSNKIHITVAIANIIIYETSFKKVLGVVRKISKTYIYPNINITPEYQLDVIHEHSMKSNLAMIKREILGLLF